MKTLQFKSWRIVWLALSVVGLLLLLSLREAGRGRGHANYGSALGSVIAGVEAMRRYENDERVHPFGRIGLKDLARWGLIDDHSARVTMWEPSAIPQVVAPSTIVLLSRQSTSLEDGGFGRYAALYSGQVLLLREADAHLGSAAPNRTKVVVRVVGDPPMPTSP